jgi:hypothetical protein
LLLAASARRNSNWLQLLWANFFFSSAALMFCCSRVHYRRLSNPVIVVRPHNYTVTERWKAVFRQMFLSTAVCDQMPLIVAQTCVQKVGTVEISTVQEMWMQQGPRQYCVFLRGEVCNSASGYAVYRHMLKSQWFVARHMITYGTGSDCREMESWRESVSPKTK